MRVSSLALSLLLGGVKLCSSNLFMVDEATNDLWSLNTATGAAIDNWDLGIDINEVAGLAYDPSTDLLYFATVPAGTGVPQLFQVDRFASQVTSIMELPAEVAGLSWDTQSNSLIGIASNILNSVTTLYEIDVSAPSATPRDVILSGDSQYLQDIVIGSLNGAAIHPTTGILYATLGSLESNDGVRLYEFTKNVDTGTYTAQILGSAGAMPSQRWGLGFEGEVLYGVSGDDNSLYEISTADGSVTQVGPLGMNVGPAIGAAGGIPTRDPTDGTGGGDPHFHTFHGEYYAYHGICDLVMVRSASFGHGAGLDVHVRTQERENYSSISNAAIKIGNDVVEMVNDGTVYVNGDTEFEFPVTLADTYTISKRVGVESQTFTPDVSHGFLAEELVESTLYSVKIGEDEHIEVQLWKDYLWVNVRGRHQNFHDSEGLMGSWGTPRRMARDKVTLLNDPTQFAEEWQVRDTEPMLFQTVRAPQHPAACLPPPPTDVARRRLGEERAAQDACSKVTGPQKEFCVYDVIATGDHGIARVYVHMEGMKQGWAA